MAENRPSLQINQSALHCEPCSTDGLIMDVFGYCKTCREHLCETCFRQHRRPYPTRGHDLLAKEHMPLVRIEPAAPNEFFTERCSLHSKEMVKFYCRNHELFVCAMCLSFEHKMCQQVDFLPDTPGEILNYSDLFKSDQIKAGTEGVEAGLAGLEIGATSYTSFSENQYLDEARPMYSSESIAGALKYDTDLVIKLQSEKEQCQLTGSTVLHNGKFLVVCDSQNKTVKMIDVLLDKIISVVPVASKPWGVAKVTDFHIFVSLIDEQKLLSMYVFNGLIEDESSTISVNGRCCGIACIKQKIIVSYITPPKVEILDMKGRMLQTIKTDDTGALLFDKPIHIAISPDGELIYTSDWSKRRVLCLDFSGLVKAKYDNIRCYGITTDLAGTVYVGCISPNSVHQLYPNCQLHKIVLGEDLLEQTPDSLTYSSKEDKLYVAQYDQEFIRRFSCC